MRLTVNTDNGKLINGFTFPEQISDNRIDIKRADSTGLDWQFGRPFGTSTELGTPLGIKFGCKIVGDNDGPYVVSNYDQDAEDFLYETVGAGVDLLYRVNPSWNTLKLNNLLGVDPEGFAEETSIRCVRDISGSLDGKFFILHDRNGSVGVWFDITGGTAAPAGALECDRQIEISTVVEDDAAADVAAEIAAALQADAEFTATAFGSLVSVTDAEIGPRTAAEAGDTGFVVTEWIAGSLPNTMANVPYVDLEGELERSEDGIITSTLTFTVRVFNDINKGTEGVPQDANPAYPAPALLLQTRDMATATVEESSESVEVDISARGLAAPPTMVLATVVLPANDSDALLIKGVFIVSANLIRVHFAAAATAAGYKVTVLFK